MLVFFLLIILILTCKIQFRIINVISETDVFVKFGIIKIHIDYDMFIKSINTIAKNTKISIKDFKKGIGYYNIIRDIISNSEVSINKMVIVKHCNNFDLINIYLNTAYYATGNYIKNFLITNTYKQQEVAFYVSASNRNDFDLNVDFEFSLFLFLKSILFNIRNIIKIKKDMI
ncbi:MAG: hypothetical protein R3Y60_04755 [bacterium]